MISTCSFTAAPREHAERPWWSSTPTPDPRAAARSDTCTALRAAQCRERRASPPLTAVCARPGRPVPAESPSRALGGLRAEGGEAEGLAECEGLPPRTSGTGHQMDLFSGQGAFHHRVGVRLIRVMRANLRARKPFARRSCPRARHGGGTSDWWSAGGFRWREESRFRGAASSRVPPCCGRLRKEQNPRPDHDPATRRLPAPEGSGSRRMAELGTANRIPAP